jgi:hypothetical protein
VEFSESLGALLGRMLASGGKLGVGIADAVVSGALKGLIEALGVERLPMFIENGWTLLESLFYGMFRRPDEAYEKLPKEEVAKYEAFRLGRLRTAVSFIGMVKKMASYVPPKLVEEKVTGGWLMKKMEERVPEAAKIIKGYGDRGRAWLDRQAEEIRDFLLGRIVFDPVKLKFVRAEQAGGAGK